MRYDRWLHGVVSFILTALMLIWFSPHVAMSTVLFIGLLKEIKDIKTTGFDLVDLFADLVGVTIALLLGGLAR